MLFQPLPLIWAYQVEREFLLSSCARLFWNSVTQSFVSWSTMVFTPTINSLARPMRAASLFFTRRQTWICIQCSPIHAEFLERLPHRCRRQNITSPSPRARLAPVGLSRAGGFGKSVDRGGVQRRSACQALVGRQGVGVRLSCRRPRSRTGLQAGLVAHERRDPTLLRDSFQRKS